MIVQNMNTLIDLLRIVASNPESNIEWEVAQHTEKKREALRRIAGLALTLSDARDFVLATDRDYHQNQTLEDALAGATRIAQAALPELIAKRNKLASMNARERFQYESGDYAIREAEFSRDALFFVPQDEETTTLDQFGQTLSF